MKFKKGDEVKLIKYNQKGTVIRCTKDMVWCIIGFGKTKVPFAHPDNVELVNKQ